MAFTDADLKKQEEQFAALEDEFARMQAQAAELLKAAGIKPEELKPIDINNLSPEMQKAMNEATDVAKRAGAARAAQALPTPSSATTRGQQPGAGRRNIVRL